MLEFNATFFVAMISFIIFMIIMNAILYKPLERIEKERAELIKNENDAAKLAQQKSNSLLEQQKAKLTKAGQIAGNNYNKKISEYKDKKESVLSNAKDLAKKDLAVANAEIEGDSKAAKLLLNSEINTLASDIASKVLGYETVVEGNE